MDIKLVKNFEEGNYIPVNEQLLLQVVDANYRLGRFPGKKIFMLNPLTNERLEILPEIHKYNLANISYAAVSHNHILFTSASSINETQVEISYYRYDVSTGAYHIIHTTVADLTKLGNVLLLKAFVLDENYCIFDEITYSRENLSSTGLFSNGMGTHKMLLKEIQENKERLLKDSVIATSGIEKLIPLSGNLCVIKLGSPMLEELVFSDTAIQPFKQKEIIGIVNIKQFISELLLNQNNAFLVLPSETLKIMADVSKKIEEVIIYDYETKVKKVRLNSNITRISDLNHTYILNDTPYIIKNTDKNTRLINLNTQKTDIKLSGDVRIKFIRRDLIVTQHHVKKMFFMRKENYYIEVFRYPDMHHSIFKTRAKYKDCIAFFDDLLIFTN